MLNILFLISIDYFQPSSKKYFEDFCTTLEGPEVELMQQIFNERSVLFLGCDPERPEYKNFFQKFAVNAKVDSCWNLQELVVIFFTCVFTLHQISFEIDMFVVILRSFYSLNITSLSLTRTQTFMKMEIS